MTRTSTPPSTSPASTDQRSVRLAQLRSVLEAGGLDGVVISRPASVGVLSGFALGPTEGPTAGYSGTLLVTAAHQLILADPRYVEQAAEQAPDWELVPTRGPLGAELAPLLQRLGVRRCGLEARVLSHADWTALAAAAPGTELHAVDDAVAELRIVKTAEEIEAIERACALGDRCFAHLLEVVRPPMTEAEIAWTLERWMREHGGEALAFESIVLAGPRASMPHGRPTERPIAAGNVLLLDFGCLVDGYRSDMTRTIFVGEPSDDLRARYAAVAAAQETALGMLRPGTEGDAVDRAAREVIATAGFEPFGHGLGHGIGLETHEPPRLRRGSTDTLRPGMVFSVEPGSYAPGVTGMRIEDIVVLEAAGPRLLTQAPRGIIII